jgi:hypothetical protein
MKNKTDSRVFDYKALRLIVGIIAFTLPYVVIWISAIGMLFIVGAFLWAYNGHTVKQKIASKVASISACLVALFPTSCDGCAVDASATIHTVAAVILFAILAYFCLGPFREKTKAQTGKKRRRARIYSVCGWLIVAAMLSAVIAKLVLSDVGAAELRVVYWVELISLNAFGIAWITAGKYIPILVDKDDALQLFGKKD